MTDEEITYTKLPGLASDIFPAVITTKDNRELYRHIIVTQDASKDFFLSLIRLIDSGIGPFYKEYEGRYWKKFKLEEMLETPIVYVYYNKQSEDHENADLLDVSRNKSNKKRLYEVEAFCSFQYTYFMHAEDTSKVLFLWEIHVSREFQKNSIGSTLLSCFYDVNKSLKTTVGTELQVFRKNKAYGWYLKHGYICAESDPSIESDPEILIRKN